MAYAPSDIIQWAKICQPLARFYQSKDLATIQGSVVNDLDMALYDTRLDVQYELDKDPTGDIIYPIANYLFSLEFPFVFAAMAATGGGGSITPVTPGGSPDPYDFEVTSSSFIVSGDTSKIITSFIGFNLLFVRNNITQSIVNQGSSYYSWNKNNGQFVLLNGSGSGAANLGELFQLYPVL